MLLSLDQNVVLQHGPVRVFVFLMMLCCQAVHEALWSFEMMTSMNLTQEIMQFLNNEKNI